MLQIYQTAGKNVSGTGVYNLGKISFLKLNEIMYFQNWRPQTNLSSTSQTRQSEMWGNSQKCRYKNC